MVTTCCTRQRTTANASAVRQELPLESATVAERYHTDAANLLAGRSGGLFACAARGWCRRQASRPLKSTAEGACTHAMLAHHTVLTCVLTSCARRRWKGSAAHIQWISLTVHAVGSCIGWWSILVCNYLQQDAARDARERVALSALYTRRTVLCGARAPWSDV